MDLSQMKSVWEAYLEVQEGKKLSAKQKKHFDKDNDGDIDDKDMAMLNKEANEPADPVQGAPSRKGDKKNHDAKQKVVAGDPDKHSKGGMAEQMVRFSTFMEKVADEWPYKDEFNFKGKNKPAQDNEPLGQSKTEPNTQQYDKHNESSTEPEGLVDKESPKSKEFIRQHQKSDKNFEVKYDQSVDDVSKAGGDAVKSQAPNRRGTDQLKNGDTKSFPKVTKEDVDQFVDSLDEEQLDELSKNLLTRYKKKADAQTTAHSASIDRRDPKNPKNPTAASSANFKKRMTGSGRADDKIKGKYAKVPATNANKGKR